MLIILELPLKYKHGLSAKGRNKSANKQYRTSTVLYVEFSRGGILLKSMREVTERLESLLEFKVKVTERGGTKLGSILSNKNLWKGQPCGRSSCRPCMQDQPEKEPCCQRNVLYESECGMCNVLGGHKERDAEGLEDKREEASIYVGETARSVSERSKEHWKDMEKEKEESHMVIHWKTSHEGEQECPPFNFRVIKSFQSSLARQISEAVRIQLRGEVLNQKGMYNRSKLTRMVVDREWDKKVWEEAWDNKNLVENPPGVKEPWKGNKSKRTEIDRRPAKRKKYFESNREGWKPPPDSQGLRRFLAEDLTLPNGWIRNNDVNSRLEDEEVSQLQVVQVAHRTIINNSYKKPCQSEARNVSAQADGVQAAKSTPFSILMNRFGGVQRGENIKILDEPKTETKEAPFTMQNQTKKMLTEAQPNTEVKFVQNQPLSL